MSWSVGFDITWGRDIGYGVPATCDHPGCGVRIDRGLSYVCGGEPYGGEDGCGLYFCPVHRSADQFCARCAAGTKPFDPTPDTAEWIHHKATDPSWSTWRAEQSAASNFATPETEHHERRR